MKLREFSNIGFPSRHNKKTKLFGLIHIAIFILTLSGVLHAEIYKWTDENGNVQFGDNPGVGVKAEKIEIKEASPAGIDQEVKKRLEKQEKLLKVLDEERNEKEEIKLAKEKEKEKRKKNCARFRDYKKRLDASGPIYDLDEEGNRVYFSEEENKAERQRVERLVREWCD